MSKLFKFESRAVRSPLAPSKIGKRYMLPDRLIRQAETRAREQRQRTERFADYFVSGTRTTRHKVVIPQIERNKIIVVAVFVALVIFSVLYRFMG